MSTIQCFSPPDRRCGQQMKIHGSESFRSRRSMDDCPPHRAWVVVNLTEVDAHQFSRPPNMLSGDCGERLSELQQKEVL